MESEKLRPCPKGGNGLRISARFAIHCCLQSLSLLVCGTFTEMDQKSRLNRAYVWAGSYTGYEKLIYSRKMPFTRQQLEEPRSRGLFHKWRSNSQFIWHLSKFVGSLLCWHFVLCGCSLPPAVGREVTAALGSARPSHCVILTRR